MTVHFADLNPNRPPWLGGGQWLLRGLSGINVVFGKNGSGKSQMLRALIPTIVEGAHYVSPERSGVFQFDQGLAQAEIEPANRGASRRNQNFATNYRKESISRVSALMMALGAAAGKGLPVHTDKVLDKLGEDVAALLPEFRFRVTVRPPFFELERLSEDGASPIPDPSQQLSSGEIESLSQALDILTACHLWELEKKKQRVLLLDEPDTHLHPDLQVRFAEFLCRVARKFHAQLLVATHSTTLLAALGHHGGDDVRVLYLNNHAQVQNAIPFSRELRDLSMLLGGHALMGPLFAAPILLVEGDDDYLVWSQVPRFPGCRHLFSVVPSDGDRIKRHQEGLEVLFASIRGAGQLPAGYALIDGDKGKPTHGQDSHVKYVQLACRELENLYLTEEVLELMSLTWEDAARKLEQVQEDHPNHNGLKALVTSDRRQTDIKPLMRSLVELFDDKHVPWTTRIAQALGKREPAGELKEFLGGEIVDALWVRRRKP